MGIAPPGDNAFDFSNLDIPGSNPGDILYKGVGGTWTFLPAGTSGHFLQTLGAGLAPQYTAVPGGGDMLAAVYDPGGLSASAFDLANFGIAGGTIGDLYVRGGVGWGRLPNSGTPGYVLTAQAGATPIWAPAAVSGVTTIANGGTGASTEGDARTNLGIGLTTGLLTGAQLSINGGDPTKFDLTNGLGSLVDESTPASPGYTTRTIASRVGVSDAFPGSPLTIVLIDSGDNIIQQTTAPTSLQRRTQILIGRLVKTGGLITSTAATPSVAYGHGKTLEDLLTGLGGIGTGSEISAFGGLQLAVAAGEAITLGRGKSADSRLPNTIALPAQSPIPVGPFNKAYETGGALVLDAANNLIDPDNYNVGGVLTPVTPLRYTTQRVFVFPETDAVLVYYGNAEYATLQLAIDARTIEDWEENFGTKEGVFRAWIIVQEGTTNLVTALAASPPRAAIITPGPVRPSVSKGAGVTTQAIFGQFSDSTAQKPIATTPTLITLDTDDGGFGMEHSRPEDIKALVAGVYSMKLQAQVERTVGGGGTVAWHGWARKGRRDGPVSAVAIGNPAPLTAPAHRLQTGQTVTLSGFITTPSINGAQVVTVVDADTFTIPVNVTAVTDGVGDWTRALDILDDVPNSNVQIGLQSTAQSDVIPISLNLCMEEEDVLNFYQSVDDATKGAGLVAIVPVGEPAIPSVILAVNKVGDT